MEEQTESKTAESGKKAGVSANVSVEETASGDESAGAVLRRARLAKHLEIREVAASLCIRPRFLDALENAEYKELPGGAYTIGFIRSYAAVLGLDADEIAGKYKSELSETAERGETIVSGLEKNGENALPGLKTVLASLALLALLFAVSKTFREEPAAFEDETAEETLPVPESSGGASGFTAVSVSPVPADTQRVAVIPPVPPEKPAFPEEGQEVSVMAESPSVAEKDVSGTPLAEGRKTDDNVPAYRIFGQKNYNPRIVLIANSNAWIKVVRGDFVLISRTLKKGDRYQVSRNSENLYLETGNAGGLDVYVEGLLLPPLGSKGERMSAIRLDAEELLSRSMKND